MVKKNRAYYEDERKQRKARTLTMVIIRDNGHHQHYQNSKPCVQCLEMLKKLKLKKIIYSTDNGGIVVTRPQRETSDHKSRAQRVTEDIIRTSSMTKKKKEKIPKKKTKKKKQRNTRYYKNLYHLD